MTVLLVDDQISVLSALVSGVNWEKTGITNIKTACSALEAKEILKETPIDLMLCDIEMPAENGLSLLRWIRSRGIDLECIFLTAHADFLYAKEALHLGSVDYILQPARYEDIQNAVQRAVLRIREKREEKVYSTYGRAAYHQKDSLLQGILVDWFLGKEASFPKILNSLRQLNYHFAESTPVFFVLIHLLRWHSEPWDFRDWSYALNNVLSELMEQNGCQLLSCRPDKTSFAFLVFAKYGPLLSDEKLLQQLKRTIRICKEEIGCESAVYTTSPFPLAALTQHASQVQKVRWDNVSRKSGLFPVDASFAQSLVTHCDIYCLQRWEKLLIDGQTKLVEKEAIHFLDELSQTGRMNQETLSSFHQDFQQIVFSAAAAKHMAAHEVLCQSGIRALEEKASESLEDMCQLIRAISTCFVSAAPFKSDDKKVITEVEAYIHSNLSKPLPCSEVAEAMFLNSDYLSRIFKQEKRIPLKEYITNAKMKSAQFLLKTTTLPISVIATKVGYDNFSHFSQVYKKALGVSPSEERKDES